LATAVTHVSASLVSLLILGALVLGYPLGLLIAKLAGKNRALARICGLAGAVMIFVGLMGGGDLRFIVLAEAGFYLQIAWLVASFKFRRTNKPQYQELWASNPGPDRSQGRAPSSFAQPAGQGARLP
jgi:hypothetical protein